MTLDYAPAVIDDCADPFRVCCVGFGRRLCSAEPIDNSPYCEQCQARADNFHARIELVPLVGQLAAHVRSALDALPRCMGAFSDVGCGAVVMREGDFCERCATTLERIYAEARRAA